MKVQYTHFYNTIALLWQRLVSHYDHRKDIKERISPTCSKVWILKLHREQKLDFKRILYDCPYMAMASTLCSMIEDFRISRLIMNFWRSKE